jgi:hypothetical protein
MREGVRPHPHIYPSLLLAVCFFSAPNDGKNENRNYLYFSVLIPDP